MLSKPSFESSAGSSALTSTSSASRSRIALAYSVRFRRWSAGASGCAPGGLARSSRASSAGGERVEHGALGPRHAARRHHARPDLADHLLPHLGVGADVVEPAGSSTSPPILARSLWQVTQYCLTKPGSAAGSGAGGGWRGARRTGAGTRGGAAAGAPGVRLAPAARLGRCGRQGGQPDARRQAAVSFVGRRGGRRAAGQLFEQGDRAGLGPRRVRGQEHAFGPRQRRAPFLVLHVEPRALARRGTG